jgi:chromosome partitioning protein
MSCEEAILMNQPNTPGHTQVLAVGNQKGGVGKTTTTVHLAAALGERGRRCLVIDLDMNQGATRHLGIPSESFMGTFEVLTGEEAPEAVIVTPDDGVTLPENVHLLPARRNLEKIDKALLAQNKFRITQDVLIEPLARLNGRYDYIFLDTAPNATTPTIAAYKAAHWFILAAMPDPLAIAGLNDALVDLQSAQQNGNPNLRLLGVVLSGVEGRRTRLASSLSDYVEAQFAPGGGRSAKFQATINRSTVIPEAQKDGLTLFQTAPRHKICDQYRALAAEVEARIGAGEPPREPLREPPVPPARAHRRERVLVEAAHG